MRACPFAHVFKLLMRRIQKDFKQIGVAARSAAVFRRATPRAIENPGILYIRLRRKNCLQSDIMLPVVSEIINIEDLRARLA